MTLADNSDTPTESTVSVPQLISNQYTSLRTEIVSRIELQHQLIALGITAAGSILAAGFLAQNPKVILIFPPLAVFLALSWRHERRILQIGVFIRTTIEANSEPHFVGWETYLDRIPKRLARSNLAVPMGIFGGTELLAVLIGAAEAKIGAVLLAIYVGTMFSPPEPVVVVLLVVGVLSLLVTCYFFIRSPRTGTPKP